MSIFFGTIGAVYIVLGILIVCISLEDGFKKANNTRWPWSPRRADDIVNVFFGAQALRARVFTTLGQVVAGVLGIVFTEKLIAINGIDLSEASFGSTNQLLPFLVGLFTFISTMTSILRESSSSLFY